ncbi:unnamed protein product, partial [Ixodes pacificus]
VAVVIAFFVCWAPFHTQRLLVVYVNPSQWTRGLRTLNEVLYYTAGCLYYFSATINPILYSLMSVKYREAFRDALCTLSKTKQRLSTADFDQAATVVVVGAGPHLLDDSRVAKLGPYSVLPQQDADTVPPVAEAPTMKYLIIQAVLGVKPNVAAVSSCVTKEADDVVSYGEEKNVNEVVRISNENSASSDVKREGETAV